MSEFLLNMRTREPAEIEAYFDGVSAGIRLYAVWRDGQQFVGSGRPLEAALADCEEMRRKVLAAHKKSST